MFSSKTISAKRFSDFVKENKLEPAEAESKLLTAEYLSNLVDRNAQLDASQVGAFVLELVREAGNALLADKVLERLEANETWKEQKVDVPALRTAVAEAKKAIEFGQTAADANAFENLAFELGLSDQDDIKYEDVLTHQKVADILTERIAIKEGDPRIAALLKRNCFDQALSRGVPLYGRGIEESRKEFVSWIRNNIEVAKKHARFSPEDLLSKQVLEAELKQWEASAKAPDEKRAEAARQIRKCQNENKDSLDLSNLRLTTLPRMIGSLSNLQTLEIGDNELESLPEWIGRLQSLQNLRVYHNKLHSLPE
jgi:hypothetical protein